jgi:hypothetical protein
MPQWLQPLTLLNPIRHFADIEGIMKRRDLYQPLALIGVSAGGRDAWNFLQATGLALAQVWM